MIIVFIIKIPFSTYFSVLFFINECGAPGLRSLVYTARVGLQRRPALGALVQHKRHRNSSLTVHTLAIAIQG